MLELTDNIFYVGAKDEKIHAYNNAYLAMGDKTALIDTVSEELSQDCIKNIEEIMPVSDIDYLICNHSEPDKSGAVKRILELNPDIEVVGTIAAIKNLKEITNMTFKEHIAKNGAVIELGRGISLEFCIVPNLNWPDTMVTYEAHSRTLFSCDIFSTYYDCDSINSDIAFDDYEKKLEEYYRLHHSPFSAFAKRAAEKISAFDIQCICPGHGPVLKEYTGNVMNKYSQWSNTEKSASKNVSVFYVSEYGYTKKMAETISETLIKCGCGVRCFNVSESNADEMIASLNSADALVFGTPTINQNAAKPVWELLSSINTVSSKNKPYFVFGSYGWGGEGTAMLHNHLKLLKLKPFDKPFTAVLNPSEEKIEELKKYTKEFSEYMKK